ncbi:MAG: hypothetical protein VB100_02245 [Angelakisella sp.]|nr:hypothetical protein [Angelakisella sp.]
MSMKKVLSVVLSLVLVFSMSVTAFAAEDSSYCLDNLKKPSISAGLNVAIVEMMVEVTNIKIGNAVAHAIRTPYDDVDWLLSYVDRVAQDTMSKAQKLGVTVVCEYVEYYIDGRYVLIDPLKVVN